MANTQYRPVHISIAGTPHRITCPSDEVANLEISAEKINEQIRDIRKEITGKIPTNEELLVLVCLDLHDQINTLKNTLDDIQSKNAQAVALIDKISKDALSAVR